MIATTMFAGTERQAAFALSLLTEIYSGDRDAAQAAFDASVAAGKMGTRQAVSKGIDFLIAQRDARRAATRAAAPVAPVVAHGHYALPGAEAGAWEFYVVKAGTGRWAGRTFCNRYRSDYLDRLTMAQQAAVMGRIAEDVDAAGQAFAAQSERCRMCGRRLTDKPTAAKNGGYGPECVTKL
jgi:hypothetical protein